MSLNVNNNVGYTVVDGGNLHIEDGIVSGFSADDYIRTAKNLPTSNISTLEWGCKFTTGSNVNYQGITGTGSYWGCYGFGIGDYGVLAITLSFSPNIILRFPVSTIKSNSTYISKAYWNATTKEFSAKVSGDNGETWTTSSMVVSDDFSYRDYPVQFGKTQAGNFRGSIDLNQTYIKVNGVTWFSGKEQASTTINEVYLNRNVGYDIVGNPTIVDGVASGFSADDYAYTTSKLTYTIDSNYADLEFVAKIKPDSLSSDTFALHYNTYSWISSGLGTNRSGKARFFIGRNSSGKDIAVIGTTSLTTSAFYYLKGVVKNNKAILLLSSDGQSWNEEGSVNLTGYTFNITGPVGIGKSTSARDYIFNGSIDLNNTYIKVNGVTWFSGKEQASPTVNEVYLNRNVGYEKVGNPTIVDGVASGFSADDYILLPSVSPKSISELIIKVKLNSSALGQDVYTNFLRGPSSFQGYTYCGTNAFIYTGFNIAGLGDLRINHNLQPDTDYWLKYTNDGTNCTVWWSEDGVNYTVGNIKESSLITDNNSGTIRVGSRSDRLAFPGSIDLNETYIKVNGVTWFSGKQTATTPIWTRSV